LSFLLPFVIPAKAGIHVFEADFKGNPGPVTHSPTLVIPAKAGIHKPTIRLKP